MAQPSSKIEVYLEIGKKRTFAGAVECSRVYGTPPIMKMSFGGRRSAVGGLFTKE